MSRIATSATKTCTICGNVQTHTAGDDCEGHYGEWINNEDGVNQDRTCEICGNQQTQPIPAPDPVIPEEPEEPEEPAPEDNTNQPEQPAEGDENVDQN